MWEVQPRTCASLHVFGVPVLEAARELGGIVSYGPRVRTRPLVKRCSDLGDTFKALTRSAGSLAANTSLGPPTAVLGQSAVRNRWVPAHIQALRTKAIKGIAGRCGWS